MSDSGIVGGSYFQFGWGFYRQVRNQYLFPEVRARSL